MKFLELTREPQRTFFFKMVIWWNKNIFTFSGHSYDNLKMPPTPLITKGTGTLARKWRKIKKRCSSFSSGDGISRSPSSLGKQDCHNGVGETDLSDHLYAKPEEDRVSGHFVSFTSHNFQLLFMFTTLYHYYYTSWETSNVFPSKGERKIVRLKLRIEPKP